MYNKYKSNLDQYFSKSQKVKLSSIIDKSKRGTIIPKDTLVVMPFVNGEVRLKILEKDTPDKGFSIPLKLNDVGLKKGLSPHYLSWFLKHDFVIEYMLPNVQGSVFPRIPKKLLFDMDIPIPAKKFVLDDNNDTSFLKTDNPFRKLIRMYYEDYLFNLDKERYNTAVILAGAISEILLYQLLLENDVHKNILTNDNSLGMAKLITYVQLLKLDKNLNFPLTHFHALRKKRNSAIHISLILKNEKQFVRKDLDSFDQIIKYFGI